MFRSLCCVKNMTSVKRCSVVFYNSNNTVNYLWDQLRSLSSSKTQLSVVDRIVSLLNKLNENEKREILTPFSTGISKFLRNVNNGRGVRKSTMIASVIHRFDNQMMKLVEEGGLTLNSVDDLIKIRDKCSITDVELLKLVRYVKKRVDVVKQQGVEDVKVLVEHHFSSVDRLLLLLGRLSEAERRQVLAPFNTGITKFLYDMNGGKAPRKSTITATAEEVDSHLMKQEGEPGVATFSSGEDLLSLCDSGVVSEGDLLRLVRHVRRKVEVLRGRGGDVDDLAVSASGDQSGAVSKVQRMAQAIYPNMDNVEYAKSVEHILSVEVEHERVTWAIINTHYTITDWDILHLNLSHYPRMIDKLNFSNINTLVSDIVSFIPSTVDLCTYEVKPIPKKVHKGAMPALLYQMSLQNLLLAALGCRIRTNQDSVQNEWQQQQCVAMSEGTFHHDQPARYEERWQHSSTSPPRVYSLESRSVGEYFSLIINRERVSGQALIMDMLNNATRYPLRAACHIEFGSEEGDVGGEDSDVRRRAEGMMSGVTHTEDRESLASCVLQALFMLEYINKLKAHASATGC